MVKEGREYLSFEAVVEREPLRLHEYQSTFRRSGAITYGYICASCYAFALQPFLDHFDRQEFLSLLKEDLTYDFLFIVHKLLGFLSLDPGSLLSPVSKNRASLPRRKRFLSWRRSLSVFWEFLKGLIPVRLRYAFKTSILPANARLAAYLPLDPALLRNDAPD